MANTYSQIYIQLVFAVQGRQCLVPPKHREELHKFITGIVQNRHQKMLAVFCMPDHAHVFFSIMKPDVSISDLARDIKAGSSKFINEQGWLNTKFSWQIGFGSFSYSKSQISHVAAYVMNQEEHHKKQSFKDEYIGFLQEYKISYDEQYLFEWI